MSILVKQVRAVDYRTERNCDILIDNGKIQAIGKTLDVSADTIIDGRGKTLLPSFVDLHVHFREPGQTQKEDIESGSKAAVHGGYTAVNLMPNTSPVVSSMAIVNAVEQRAKEVNLCDIYQTVSITENFDGTTITHLKDIDDRIQWLTDDGNGIDSTQVMLEVMEYAKKRGFGLMLHEEHRVLTPRNSYLAEDLPTYRDSVLAGMTGCKTHFCHVSTKESLGFIWDAKQNGAPVTCEVTPHHLYLNDTNPGRVAPPLRSEEHRQALIQAVKDGWVDAIATDHAPHTPEDKAAGMNGFTGLDLGFATSYTVLVKQNGLPLTALSKLMSKNPADLMEIPGGSIEEGAPANLVLLDLETPFTVTEQHIHSKSKNSPLFGETLYGQVFLTVKEGRIVYEKTSH